MRLHAKQGGFTIVEVLITLIIAAVLLGLGVMGVSTLQAQGRDAERKNDIEALARALEQRYNVGNKLYDDTAESGAGPNDKAIKGSYPSTKEYWDAVDNPPNGHNNNPEYIYSMFPGASAQSFVDPSGRSQSLLCLTRNSFGGEDGCEQVSARPTSRILHKIKSQDAFFDSDKGKTVYLYEPISGDGGICVDQSFTNPCRAYNLYYWSEIENTYKKVESKHR